MNRNNRLYTTDADGEKQFTAAGLLLQFWIVSEGGGQILDAGEHALARRVFDTVIEAWHDGAAPACLSAGPPASEMTDAQLLHTEIKVRAERKCGEMLRDSAERGERATRQLHKGSMSDVATCPPTLADIGITRDQSSRYQQLAAMPDEHFETAVATAKNSAGEVTTAFMLREARGDRHDRGSLYIARRPPGCTRSSIGPTRHRSTEP